MSRAAAAPSIDRLLTQRARFKTFLVARLGNEADAEDVLQTGLIKALEHAGAVRDDRKRVAWFYRLLRNAIIDHQRGKQAAQRRDHAWSVALLAQDSDAQRQHCACLERLLPRLKPAQARLIREVELRGKPVATAARELGLTASNASVNLHRARTALRRQLIAFCGSCADGACLDCTCDASA